MRADICKILGIKYPIIMGGMTLVSGSSLVAAVSNAGAWASSPPATRPRRAASSGSAARSAASRS